MFSKTWQNSRSITVEHVIVISDRCNYYRQWLVMGDKLIHNVLFKKPKSLADGQQSSVPEAYFEGVRYGTL